MGTETHITWTDKTWNPWHGCRKVSQGCKHCYMYRDKARYGQDPTQVVRSKDATFYAPLKWEQEAIKAGQRFRVFTCSWSDFFIEEADGWRDEAMALMALTPHLTYQVLTKRPERMLRYLTDGLLLERLIDLVRNDTSGSSLILHWTEYGQSLCDFRAWPLPNCWLGVSVEDQATAEDRIPLLLQAPAAKRFVSYEPALGAVDFDNLLIKDGLPGEWNISALECDVDARDDFPFGGATLDWIIIGGESGPDARPFVLDWARQTIAQCRAAGVACFVKQLGAFPIQPYEVGSAKGEGYRILKFRNRAGTDPEEWPIDLRVQEWPEEEGTHP